MRVYVWSLSTRVFHALLIVATLGAFITSETEWLLTLHVAFGTLIVALVLYRIIWGFAGVKYSGFKDFNLNMVDLKEYMLNIFAQKKEYIAHNPAASFAVLSMLIIMLALGVSGYLTYGVQENRGVFAYLHNSFFRDMELFEELHEFLASILIAVIALHVGGVLLERVLHPKKRVLESMLDGYKNADNENAKDVRVNIFQKLLSIIGIGFAIFIFFYIIIAQNNPFIKSYHSSIDFKKEHPPFASECSSCHTLYPPSLLPKKSWIDIMQNLDNHFGDDASLSSQDNISIREYLTKNSAQNSTSEASTKILKSINDKDIIAITQTNFWQERHREIESKIFTSNAVKSKANCKACHSDIENNLIEDINIKVPKEA